MTTEPGDTLKIERQQYLGRSKAEWKAVKAAISNVTAQKAEGFTLMLDTVLQLTHRLSEEQCQPANFEYLLSEIVTPSVSSVLGQSTTQFVQQAQKINQFLLGVARQACKLYKSHGNQSQETRRLFKTVFELSRRWFSTNSTRQKSNMIDYSALPTIGPPTWQQYSQSATLPLADPNKPIPLHQDSDKITEPGISAPLPMIPEEDQRKEDVGNLILADQELLPVYQDSKFKTVERKGKVKETTALVQIFLSQFGDAFFNLAGNSVDYVIRLMEVWNDVSQIMFTAYISETFTEMMDGIRNYFYNMEEQNVKTLSKQSVQNIILNIEKMFDRIGQTKEKYCWVEVFMAELTLIMIRSNTLKVKALGAKLLSQMSYRIHFNESKHITEKSHLQWLIRNKVLQQLIGLHNHDQVIQSSIEIVKFLIRNEAIKKQELKNIFAMAQMAEPATRKAILKPISEISMRFSHPEVKYIMEWVQNQTVLWSQEIIQMMYYALRYTDKAKSDEGRIIFEKQVCRNFESYPTTIKEKLVKRYIDLLSGALESRFVDDPKAILYKLVEYFSQNPTTHLLSLIKKYIELFPYRTEDTKFATHNCTIFQLVKTLIQANKFHNKLLEICTNSASSGILREQSVEMLTYLVMKYKEEVSSEEHLSHHIMLKLTSFSKIFGQLIFYFKESQPQLFSLIVSSDVKNVETLTCLEDLFIKINDDKIYPVLKNSDLTYEVTVPPKNLNGYQQMLNLVDGSEVGQAAAKFILMLYVSYKKGGETDRTLFWEFLDGTIQKLKKAQLQKNNRQISGCLMLIQQAMNETETRGVGVLTPHSSLATVESISIIVQNSVNYSYNADRKLETKYPANKTLYELLVTIGHHFRCSADEIKLKKDDVEIPATRNGESLDNLNINGKLMYALRRDRQPLKKVPLMENNKLTPRAYGVFRDIFFKFSPSGQMSREELAKFTQASTNQQSYSVTDDRVVGVFSLWDKDRDDILQLEDFIGFFQDSIRSKESVVWHNLTSLRYRNDLLKEEEVVQTVDYETLVRFKLYKTPEIYDILFEFSQSTDQGVRNRAIALLKRLPTDPRVIDRILEHVEFNEADEFLNWYRLIVIQHLLTMPETTKNSENREKYGIYQIDTQKIKNWKSKFIQSKLYVQIFKQAQSLSKKSLKQMTHNEKNNFALCLQILRAFLDIPPLNKDLTDVVTIKTLIELPETEIPQKLIPQLYENTTDELLQVIFCFILIRKNKINFNLIKQLLFHKESQVRLMASNFVYLYQKQNKQHLNLFDIEPQAKYSRQFFKMLVRVLAEDDKIDLQAMLSKTLKELKNYEVKQGISTNRHDPLLQGKLQILENIFILQPKLIPHDKQFQEMLLEKLNKTLSADNRDILYRLLLRTNAQGIMSHLQDFLSGIEPKKPTTVRANGHVGLINLGCICYMNAMLQQLFMTNEFKYALLNIDLSGRSIGTKERKGKKYRDSVLYQLQQLFAFLELSQRGDYSPQEFCYSYKSDINVSIQEDTEEFMNILFNSLEKQLKETPFEQILKNVFGGQTISTVTCQSCKTALHRVEDFLNISLQVEHHKSIHESLDNFIKSQSISDYFCENCQQKRNISRNQHIHSLPNTLIIHLQRLIFNYETYNRSKVHSSLSFPNSLNLSKYVMVPEGQIKPTDEECQYELKGIIIHQGNAEGGHYYSLIRQDSVWLKFNDSSVTTFNSSDIASESYGGKQETEDWAYVDSSSRSKNAYLLVYDKVLKKPININKNRQKEVREAIITEEHIDSNLLNIKKFTGHVLPLLKQQIHFDNNTVFYKEIQVYHKNFFKFIKNLINQSPLPRQLCEAAENSDMQYYRQYQEIPPAIRQHMIHMMRTLHRIILFMLKLSEVDQELIKFITAYLCLLYFGLPDMCQIHLLSLDIKRHLDIMTTHVDQNIRQLHRILLNKSLNVVTQFNNVNLQKEEPNHVKDRITQILEAVLEQLPEVSKNAGKMKQYFEFWSVFCQSTQTFMDYCFQKNMLVQLVSFVLTKKSPVQFQIPYKLDHSQEAVSSNSGPIIQAITAMALVSSRLKPLDMDNPRHFLTAEQQQCLRHNGLYKQLLDADTDLPDLLSLISYQCFENEQFSEQIGRLLVTSINQSSLYKSALAYMTAIHGFLCIDDTLSHRRFSIVLGVPQFNGENNDYSIKASLHSQVVTYPSSLFFNTESNRSVLEILFQQRKNPDSSTVAGVNILLSLLNSSDKALRYVCSLPPPTYFYSKYIDWVEEFVEAFRNDKYVVLTDRQKQAQNIIQLFNNINIKVSNILEKEVESTEQVYPDVLTSLLPQYIVGRNHHVETLEELDMSVNSAVIIVRPTVQFAFVKKSLPTGVNNHALPKQTFNTFNITPEQEVENMKTVKYFTYNSEPVVIDDGDSVPQVQPFIITLDIESTVQIKVSLTHPRFRHDILLSQGKSKINVPYTMEPVFTWLCVQAKIKEEVPQVKQKYEAPIQHVDADFMEIACPQCTLVNVGLKECDACGAIL